MEYIGEKYNDSYQNSIESGFYKTVSIRYYTGPLPHSDILPTRDWFTAG